jgi:Na+/proline symporter
MLISHFTAKGADSQSFFIGNKNSPWYIVAFGMIGTSLSGVTFISVPGWVGATQFSYLQMVFGYLLGYLVVGGVLLPLYYRLNLTSIYTYLEGRFGFWTYKTGAFYFILSRTIGAAFRLFLVANVLQLAMFDAWGVPYALTVAVTILLIWVYTFKGGIKTIVWTDSLQTFFMLTAVGITVWQIGSSFQMGFAGIVETISESDLSKTFFFEDWKSKQYFWKQFLSGALITVVMTGLDQDMMQKNLSCKNLRDSRLNMFSFSLILVLVNLMFLSLGVLLYYYAAETSMEIPAKGDELYPTIALSGQLGIGVSILFLLGLVAAAYSSADSALTALTTSVCIDLLDINSKSEKQKDRSRKRVHLLMSGLLFVVIMLFSLINDESVISELFTAAAYTYGPLLGLFAFGLTTKLEVEDKRVPLLCLLSPFITYMVDTNAADWFNGFEFGYEILLLNGMITYLGLLLLRQRN